MVNLDLGMVEWFGFLPAWFSSSFLWGERGNTELYRLKEANSL